MSYPKDLDEYTSEELRRELDRRQEAIAKGDCDYCGRSGDSKACKFPDRHLRAALILQQLHRDAAGIPRVGVNRPGPR